MEAGFAIYDRNSLVLVLRRRVVRMVTAVFQNILILFYVPYQLDQ